uniref:Uncharacterized protein n=1 Tax=Lepeophtheirus salmonis TaxID=72036 RepID=A0A0K2SWZ5_LEPSM
MRLLIYRSSNTWLIIPRLNKENPFFFVKTFLNIIIIIF